MERRTFLTISGGALTALAADWALGPTGALAQARDGKPVDDDFLTLLENTSQPLAGLATEQRQHTALLLDAYLATVTELIQHGRYSPATGHRLHTLAASLAQTVAWHRFDLGQHAPASQYWVAALHNAHAAGDHDMGAGLLGDLAYQAAWRKDHTTAASILGHALTRAQNPAARCLLQLRLARTLAAQNDRQAVLRALSAAEKHLADSGTDRPVWCSWASEADLAVDSGQALLDLGDTGRAQQLITEGEQLLPVARDKTRGVFLTYQAASHLDQKEPEPAAAAATQALLLARRIGAPPLHQPRRSPPPPLPALPPHARCSRAPPRRRRLTAHRRPETSASAGPGSSTSSGPPTAGQQRSIWPASRDNGPYQCEARPDNAGDGPQFIAVFEAIRSATPRARATARSPAAGAG
ncbi:XRE family transcriptional regulator [Streptomyces sp. 039-1]|uniref:XRE family transcriptional regulator n=1 Tax=Streptomyces sp. 039-1 TaxID=2789263 RepID=UPI0039F5DB0C